MISTRIIDKRSLTGYFAIALLSFPLFFINVRDSHDWGDDFAGYIHQAENIVKGIPQSHTGFLYNRDFHDISVIPDIGFPLLLAPAYAIFGNDVQAFQIFISMLLFLLSVVLMYYYNRYFSPLTSIFLCLILIYNPWVLGLKGEILSDIPFTLVLVLSVIWVQFIGIKKTMYALVLGILAGYLISIRTIGLTFPLALCCVFIKNFIGTTESNEKKNLIKNNLIVAAGTIGIYLLLNKFLFPIPADASYIVPEQLSLSGIGSAILTNLDTYSNSIYSFFRDLGRYTILSVIIRSLAVVSLVIGIIWKYREKMDFMDYLVAVYMPAILIFGGVDRYLFPMLPFLLHYMVIGLERIKLNLTINKNTVVSILGTFVLMTYYPEVKWIVHYQHEIKKGPQEAASVEAFDYIKKNTPENSVIVFARPRALSLYTGRTGMCNEPTEDLQKLKEKFKKMGASYMLIHSEETREPTLKKFAEEYQAEVRLEWSNEKFSLYRI